MVGCCGHGNETLRSIKCRFVDHETNGLSRMTLYVQLSCLEEKEERSCQRHVTSRVLHQRN